MTQPSHPDAPVPQRSRREILARFGKATAALPFEAARTFAIAPAAMRTVERKTVRNKALPSLPPLGVIALNRMGFGPRPGDLDAFNVLGGNDTSRLTAYVNQQLNPSSITDTAVENRIAAAGFTTLGKSLQQLWLDHHVNDTNWDEHIRPIVETERVTFLRAIYSRRQLLEVLTDFWHNHFNVLGWEYSIIPIFVHYDRDVIRANALGNFRQMLEDVARSPQMLYYLDNYTSSNAGPNENYSRELFELHAMGAENYLGVMQQNAVPLDGDGFPIGYVDADVYETTRCFTGWTVNDGCCANTGAFLYRDERHDRFQKTVLGTFMPADQTALKDGMDVLDALAEHPGTARFICRKLCRRLIADNPPQSIVDQAAAVWRANLGAPDQIAQVVRTILLSTEFRTTWGEKVKRPFEIVVSAMRAGKANFSFRIDDSDTNTFLWRYGQTGQELFSWPAPNGYPDHRAAWVSNTPRAMTWKLLNWLVDVRDNQDVYRLDAFAQTPSNVRSSNALADFWIDRVLGRPMPASERQEIVDFMAQGYNPTYNLPLDTDDDLRERLQSMVALIFMSPAFSWR